MAKYTGPSRPCHDCALVGKNVEATENLGMRLVGANGNRKLGLFCKECADYRTGKGPKFSWSQLTGGSPTPKPETPPKKEAPEPPLPPPTLFDPVD